MNLANTYEKRRLALGKTFSRTLFIISSGCEVPRSHSVFYKYKVPSDFLYLTGLNATPESVLVIFAENAYLFLKEYDNKSMLWDGWNFFSSEDKGSLGNLKIESMARLAEFTQEYAKECDRIAFPIGRNESVDQLAFAMVKYRGVHGKRKSGILMACDSRILIGQTRMIKESYEIEQLKVAGKKTSASFLNLMKKSFVGHKETEIANWIELEFLKADMPWTAYTTIVGSAERSTILHGRPTSRTIRDGEIVLIDAGGEWNGYCSDVTRVMPAGKQFSRKQKNIYNAVLKSQLHALENIRPGITLNSLNELTRKFLLENLQSIGLDKSLLEEQVRDLMPHSTSHWIGLDVHDPAPYCDDDGNEVRLQPGMCFTVEPGVYFRQQNFAEYFGMGVRIEDDVVVTDGGCELLTDIPKQADEIEEIRLIQNT